ncbi:MAG TPA: response regulator [Pirellulales bacterium]|nr:response regulator [Pirellulales bacterium]
MLVLSRKIGEKILIPSLGASIEVVEVKGGRVRLGIDAPRNVQIVREEIASSSSNAIASPAANVEVNQAQLEHAFRNKLNVLALKLSLAQQQLQLGANADAADTISDLLNQVTMVDAPQPPALQSRPQPKATVLVVEDDAGERELLATVLRSSGIDVATAVDGMDALNFLQNAAAPQLVLLDMMMPRCDGMTTVRIMRRNPVFDGIKIVAMSGYGRDQFGVAERAAGIDAWYEKPLDPSRLVREMKKLLSVPVAGVS